MKSKKTSRIECYDTTAVLKKNFLIITKSDSTGLSKLLSNVKKRKTTKNARRWTGNKLQLFVDVLADPESNFAISLKILALKSQPTMKYSSISKILLRWKWITEFSNRIMLTK